MRKRGPDPIRNDRRRTRRQQKLPPDAACTFCGWKTLDELLRLGRTLVEQDHVDGHANNPDLTAPECPNCHAVHGEGQRRAGAILTHDDDRSRLEIQADAFRSRAAFHRQLAETEEQQARELDLLAAALDRVAAGWRDLPEARK
jgi:hypothetical protein